MRLIVWCKTCQHQAEPDIAEQVASYGADASVIDWRGGYAARPAEGGRWISWSVVRHPYALPNHPVAAVSFAILLEVAAYKQQIRQTPRRAATKPAELFPPGSLGCAFAAFVLDALDLLGLTVRLFDPDQGREAINASG